jgi:hypothetical protein
MAVIQPSRLLNRKNILLLADIIKSLLHLQYISLSSQADAGNLKQNYNIKVVEQQPF